MMGRRKDEYLSIQEVEEGEISDSASVEEISKEDFVKPEANISNSNSNSDPKPMIWTIEDLYKYQNKYQTSRNCTPGFHNLAWRQAVQNKPLDEILEFNNTENSSIKRSASSNSIKTDNKKNSDGRSTNSSPKEVVVSEVRCDEADDAKMEDVDGGEKEEGELEEGEIDLECESDIREGGSKYNETDANIANVNVKETVLAKRMKLIREGLDDGILNDEDKSYDRVCSRLQNSFDCLAQLVLENSVPKNDALVQLCSSAIQRVRSVFSSIIEDTNSKDHNSASLLRLLAHVTSQKPTLFTPEQIKEIEEVMIPSLESCAVPSSPKDRDMVKDVQFIGRGNRSDLNYSDHSSYQEGTCVDKLVSDLMPIDSSLEHTNNHQIVLKDSLKRGAAKSKGRGTLVPLIDLHKDHDVDSLPSPTREDPPPCLLGDGRGRPEFPVFREAERIAMHPYETDAVKAVSFYQQKFGRSSHMNNNRLPSPTPSEDDDDDGCGGGGDTSGEVSSSSPSVNMVPTLAHPTVSSSSMIHVGGQGLTNFRDAIPVNSSGSSTSVLRPPPKSRDPRLRLVSSDVAATSTLDLNQSPSAMVMNKVDDPVGRTRKQKKAVVEESSSSSSSFLDGGPSPKRQRNDLIDYTIRNAVSETGGGWLEDSRGAPAVVQVANRRSDSLQNAGGGGVEPMRSEIASAPTTTSSSLPTTMNENGQLPYTCATTTPSTHTILKDIAVEEKLRNIIKMHEHKSATDTTKTTTQSISLSSIIGVVPPLSNAPPPTPLPPGQKSSSTEEPGKIRMKPRDPRRVLHTNSSSHKCSRVGENTSSAQGKGNLSSQKQQEEQLVKTSGLTQSTSPPDIGQQFKKNLKSIADYMSVSQASTSPPPPTSIQPVQQVHPSWVDIKGVTESGLLQQQQKAASEEVAAGGPTKLQQNNTWREVEHLFDGFDDQQKAAIQRERARRIEEQKKMFSARKLCLVLDLDHTLLNSAKFVEIEPSHDELLRKKEEQDREKPQRHLFRFPHMGMWTKLRPGIWNFLEKASKLFEMHLYTMGNKLYATEMAKVLDPKGVLFSGRVISKGDDGDIIDGDERIPKSKDLEGVLGMESAVVIIDDSVRVWPHNKLNLIVVERYIYFPCSRRQFGLPGPSLLEIDHDERPEDGTLASSLAVIERIHENFFQHKSLEEADVRNILASEQQKILGGCRIVFSRVFPVGEANPHLHPLWQTAEQFGAVCTNQIDEQVTHVVANSLGTDKVNWALSTGRFVVHPGWVEASALLYRRVNEHDFAIKP